LLPAEYIQELSKLQDKVPPYPFAEAQAILEKELPRPLSETFTSIDPQPLAAASIAQVHRARMLGGEEVVVKVQRPGIARVIEVDLEILLHMATLLERHVEGWELHKPTEVVAEFGETLEKELDFTIEAANFERMAALFQDDPKVCFPKVFREATTGKVLTMEYVKGIPAGAVERLREEGYDLSEIAARGADLLLEQMLLYGFFQADPHPGNLMILPQNVICLLDMGMVGRLDQATRASMVDLMLGVVRCDYSSVVRALLSLTVWEDEPDRKALEREIAAVMDIHLNRPLKELELGRFLQQLFRAAHKFRLRVPPDLLLLIKALATTESLGRKLDPEFDLVKKAAPFVKKVYLERYQPQRLAGDFWEYGSDLIQLARQLPLDLRTLLRLARKGRLQLEIKHLDLENLQLSQTQNNNLLSFAIVLAGLIIGSSVVIHSGIPPTWHNIPLIGLAGFMVAGLMGFWLLISILRRGLM
ncbi:MAG: AarF/ABC1/UbiB kinase family protein, partial [Pseudomonadota bacterium]